MGNNNETTTKFKVDISELKKSMQDAKRQISIANSEFKNVSSSMDDWSKSTDGISAKLKQLDSNLKSQKTILKSLEQQYEQVVAEQGEGSAAADRLKVSINNQKAAINKTEREISNYEKSLDEVSEAEKIAAKTGKSVADVLDDIDDKAKNAGDGFTVMKGVLANLVTSGINLVVDGLKNMVGTMKESYESFDEGADIIIQKTGAVGEAAKSLQNSYKNVSKSVAGEFTDIGTAIGEVNTRFGVTGKDLENLSTKFLKFAELNGTDVNDSIDSVQKTLAAFGLEAKDADGVLDTLNKVGQDTGISMDDLSKLLMENASSFSQMGLDVHQAAVFLGNVEKSGVDTATAMTSLSKASQYAVKENKPLTQVLKETTDKMKNAKTDTEGLEVAYDVFGKKAGAKIYEACKQGTLSFEDLSKAMQNNSGSIDETYEATQDGMDKIKLAVQGAKADVGDAIASFLDEHKDDIVKGIETVTTGVKDFFNFVKDNGDTILATLSGIATAFVAWKVASLITGVVNAIKAFKAANEGATVAQWLLNAAMNANPIGIIVALIAGLVAAFVVLWKKSDSFRNFWIGLWEKIQEACSVAKEWIGEKIEEIGKFFTETLPNFFKGVIEWIKKNWKSILLFLVNPFAGLFKYFYDNNSKFKEFVDNAIKYIKELPSKVWTWLVNTINKITTWRNNMINKAKEAALGFINKVVEFVKQLPSKVWTWLVNVVSKVASWGLNMATKAKEVATKFVTSVVNFIKQLPSKIWTWLSNAASKVVSWGSSLASKGREAATKLLNAIVDKVKSIPSKLLSIGKDIVKGLWNGIGNATSWLKSKIKGFVGDVTGWLKKFFKIGSPSKLMRDEIGRWLPEGMAVGIDRNAKSVLSSMRNLASDTLGVARDGLTTTGRVLGTTGGVSGGVTNNFYQTINSPKQLSRLDIYRQSKNLLGYAGGGH